MGDKAKKDAEYYTALASCIGLGTLFPFPLNAGLIGAGVIGIGLEIIDVLSKNNEYNKFFLKAGICDKESLPVLLKKEKKDYGYDLMFTLPLGKSLNDFTKDSKLEAFEQFLNAKIEAEYFNKRIFFRVKDLNQNHFYEYEFVETKHPLEILIGINETTKKYITLRLDSSNPHVCVGGETGGGKTVWMVTMLVNIIKNIINNPKFDCVEIDIVDPKRVDYVEFEESKYIKHFVKDMKDIDKYLSNSVREMNRRIKLLENVKARNLESYNKKVKEKLKYKLIIIDELADITSYEDKEVRKRMEHNLTDIVRKGRFVGMHVIGATQKATADAIPTAIRGNMPVKIAFKSSDGKMSEVILDNTKAKKLRGKGHGIYKNREQIEFQGMFIDDQTEGVVYELIKDSCYSENPNDNTPNDIDKENAIVVDKKDYKVNDANVKPKNGLIKL